MVGNRVERTTRRDGNAKAQDGDSGSDEPGTSGLCAIVGRSRLGTNTTVVTQRDSQFAVLSSRFEVSVLRLVCIRSGFAFRLRAKRCAGPP
jgi:hypothetical protein